MRTTITTDFSVGDLVYVVVAGRTQHSSVVARKVRAIRVYLDVSATITAYLFSGDPDLAYTGDVFDSEEVAFAECCDRNATLQGA